jgi:lactate permease
LILLTALAPLLLVLILLIGFRLKTSAAMAVAFAVSSVLAYHYWEIPLTNLAAATVEGVIIAATVLWIMAGALFLLAYQKQTGQLDVIRHGFAKLSPDPRLQLLWVGWFGVAFLEGIAGFGTPAAILAPLLVTLGFSPIAAVVLTLIADSAPVSFGALGTPLLIGVAQGAQLPATELLAVANQLVLLDLFAAPVLPVLMLVLYCRLFNPQLPLRPALPHALVAGFAYSISAWCWLQLAGPEFPSVLAALSGFLVSYLYQRCRPMAGAVTVTTPDSGNSVTSRQIWSALAPYLAVILLLLLSRLPELPFKAALLSYQWSFDHLFGTTISTQVTPLYLPGTLFILVVLLFLLNRRKPGALLLSCWQDCWPKLSGAALTLLFALPLVRLFVHSEVNTAGLPAMPAYLATVAGNSLAEYWLGFSALLGALGAFIAGSATFSNLLFAEMQLNLAKQAALDPTLVLALQMLGANAGNMVCLLNLVAAASVVGLQGQERSLLKLTVGPMLIYLLLGSVTAWALFG